MLHFLKNHPFPVEAYFKSSLVFTFAVPIQQLAGIIPPCLTLDTFNNQYAFIAVAMVDTTGLRPKGFPPVLGNNFFLIGYRIFVQYTNTAGKRLRGLYIIKSETNKRKMQVLGNIFTHYNYTTTDIQQHINSHTTQITSVKSNFNVLIEESGETAVLPTGSPFANWKEARRFAGPLPFTFTYNAEKREILIIEGVRQNWVPKPVTVISQHFSFIQSLQLTGAVLANAFIIKNISYYWKSGKKETWNP